MPAVCCVRAWSTGTCHQPPVSHTPALPPACLPFCLPACGCCLSACRACAVTDDEDADEQSLAHVAVDTQGQGPLSPCVVVVGEVVSLGELLPGLQGS